MKDQPIIANPPFDNSTPCLCCPAEVRNLYAVAYNASNAYNSRVTEPQRFGRKMAELDETLRQFRTFIDGHFADKAHAYGPR